MTHAASVGFDAIGTRWTIDTADPLDPELVRRVTARVEAFDATYSRFRADSLVSQMGRRAGRHRFPDDAEPLLRLYRDLYEATGGALTPLVGQVMEHLGYGPGYRLTRGPGVVTAPAWDDVLTVRGSVVVTRQPVVLDVGAAGKGYLVDRVAELLADGGVADFVIDASGDLLHRGAAVERVGLEDPSDPTRIVGIANLANQALCASAANRRGWGDGLHHIVDPATGEPVHSVLASWATHPSCAVADGLATALFLTEPDQLARHFAFTYVRLLADGRAQLSTNFDGELLS